MRIVYFFLLLLLFSFSSNIVLAQLTVTQGAGLGLTPLQLVQSMLMGPGATISNVTFNGSSANITSNQIGSFQCTGGAYGQLGLSSGIIISSGTAIGAIGPNLTESFTGSIPSGAGDADLAILADTITHDAAIVEFDYVPVSDTINFKYVFGTEEFMYYCNQFNDPFGIFLSGPGISGPFSNNSIDIALLPGNNNYVTVNNLCSDSTPLWFNPQGGIYFQYNYLTYVLTAWHIVQPCQTYHVKIAISDAKDYALDAGTFLGQNNFSTAGFSVENTYTHPELGHFAVAGCSDATVTIHLLTNAIANDTITYTLGGTAINGTDYNTINNYMVIPAGSDSAFVTINPFMDIVPTGNKTVILGFETLNCNGGTNFQDTISIHPNYPLTVHLRNDTTICQHPITIAANHAGGQPPYSYLWNTGSFLPQITVTPSIGPNLYYVDVTDDCSATDRDSIIITGENSPVITNPILISSVCTGHSTNIVLQSSIPGSTFTWTTTCSDPNISGYSAGSGPTITQLLTNTGTTIDTVTYHVFVSAVGCTSYQSTDFKVAVDLVADVYFQPNGQSICSGTTTSISILSHVPGTTFSWTYIYGSGNLSGAANGSGNLISQTLSNSGYTTDTVTYQVSPSNSGCPNAVTNVKVAVHPIPDSWAMPAAQTICSGSNTSLSLFSHLAGTTFTWTATCSSPNISGYASGSGNTIIQTLTNSGVNLGTVTYIVTPTLLGCTGPLTAIVVTVFPAVDVYFVPNGQSICSGTATSIKLNSHVPGTTYTWTATGTSGNVSGYSASSGNVIRQVLNNSANDVEGVTYVVTPSANGCRGPSNNVVVAVNPLPQVTFTPCTDVVTTTDAVPFILKGGLPLGGTYSGTGVNAGQFNPGIAGTGIKIITYSYTNTFGCVKVATQNIIVRNPLPFFCNNLMRDVRDNQQYPTVLIGAQCWMAVNLNYGTQIQSSSMQRDNCTFEKYCYNDNFTNCATMGGLYQWDEIMQYQNTETSQGMCPPAWHIPSENEWNILFANYINNGYSGTHLKYNGNSGFNALLNGIRFDNRNWDFDTFASFFWSSTSQGPYKAWSHAMNSINPSVSYYPSNRSNAFYVRCIKN